MSKDNGIYVIHFKDGIYVKELFAAQNIVNDVSCLYSTIKPYDRKFHDSKEASDFAYSMDCEKRTEHGILYLYKYHELNLQDLEDASNDSNSQSKLLSM